MNRAAMMLIATSIRAMQKSAIKDRVRRDSAMPRHGSISIGLLEIDQDRGGAKEGDHQREEVDEISQVDDAAGDRAEMPKQAGPGDGSGEPFGRPALEQAEHH